MTSETITISEKIKTAYRDDEMIDSNFKELRFESYEKFQEWLNEIAVKKITLEDMGQDFTEFWIDERGEILHTLPFQANIWNGRVIVSDTIKEGEYIKFQDGSTLKYRNVKIEELK